MEKLTLWGRPSSSNTQKVLWALSEAGIDDFEFVMASARLGPESEYLGVSAFGVVDTPAYLAMNPHGTIPTLKQGSDVVWESHTIVRYIAMARSPSLFGGSVGGFARASAWMDWVLHNSDISNANNHMCDTTARTPVQGWDKSLVESCHSQYVEELQKVERHLQITGNKFLAGDEFSIADIPFGAELNRWSLCVHSASHKAALELPRPHLPQLAAYYERLHRRAAFVDNISRTEHLTVGSARLRRIHTVHQNLSKAPHLALICSRLVCCLHCGSRLADHSVLQIPCGS